MGAFHAENTRCIILSAGRSERMGAPKAFLRFSETEDFLQHVINIYRQAGIGMITVVINPMLAKTIRYDNYPGTNFVVNRWPERGRLSSVKTGLESGTAGFCFIQNIDNPFVSPSIISKLLEAPPKSGGYTVPVYKGKGRHPILISPELAREIIRLEQTETPLNEVLRNYERHPVETDDESILANINTPDEYERLFLGTRAITAEM
jgi:molybdenum cofactor cytidylyltransferase